jgi:hypothetical protein
MRIIKGIRFTRILTGKKMASQSLISKSLGYFQGLSGQGKGIRRVAG